MRFKSIIQKLKEYVLDVQKTKELELFDYNVEPITDPNTDDFEKQRDAPFFASKVKPKDFVEWAKTLPIAIPMINKGDRENPKPLSDRERASLSRAVLLHYWNEITKGLYLMNIDTKSCEGLIDNIRVHFPSKRPNTVLALMGFVQTCQEVRIRGARLFLRLSDAQFYRLKADAKKLDQNTKCPRFTILGAIRAQLMEFIPLIRADIVTEELLDSPIHHNSNYIEKYMVQPYS